MTTSGRKKTVRETACKLFPLLSKLLTLASHAEVFFTHYHIQPPPQAPWGLQHAYACAFDGGVDPAVCMPGAGRQGRPEIVWLSQEACVVPGEPQGPLKTGLWELC